MRLSADQLIFWQHGFIKLNGTIVFTWGLMLVLAVGSKLITRKLSTDLKRSRWQNLLEIVVTGIEKQIEDVGLKHPEKYIGFLGTLFLFVALAALCTVIPGYEPPTGSLSTTAALALCVFVAVPLFGIEEQGLWGYLVSYTKPTIIMLPFNIAHTRAGHPPVRQHDERRDDCCDSAHHHAVHFSNLHDVARFADRHGASLHF
jgi:F-type H+-transporting ATPase subunit a